ncbi:MAG: bifunctional 2',3'-cyclic-nucleotide 2'-phosphodiesterase/3'-nucleotidase [Pseudomonadota bacterium]
MAGSSKIGPRYNNWQIGNLGFMKVQDNGSSVTEAQFMMDPARQGSGPSPLTLRVLATSDVHAHLRGFDYARGVVVEDWGLTRIASCVAQARGEMPVSVLLDNGDMLQGTPLAELYSDPAHQGSHPVMQAMAAMGYDAVGLGNHEFNYGLDWLGRVLDESDIPVLCANVLAHKGAVADEDTPLRPASVILEREVADPLTGQMRPLRIGVLSVLPVQVMNWDGANLIGRVQTRDMVEAARAHAAQLRADGADVVVLLAHTGIDPDGTHPGAENAAVALAQVPGIDAMVTGHTHGVFPGGPSLTDAIDPVAGTLHSMPTVMPGFRGSHLGVIDLDLTWQEGRWRVEGSRVQARAVKGAPEDEDVLRVIDPAHQATLDYIHQPLGHSVHPIHSYLAQVRDDAPTRLVAMAQKALIEARLAGSEFADLPLLSASAPYQTGGRAGPLAYIDIPAGPLTMREATSLYPFPNTLCALRATGAELRDWLDRAASAYCQIVPGQGDQPLLSSAFPGHAVDTIYGLTYRIDLTLPPAYDDKGLRIAPLGAPSRIVNLMHAGAPVGTDDEFVVVVNGYRAYGGGPYAPVATDRILLQTEPCALQSVADYLAAGGANVVPGEPAWSFLPVAGARGVFETGPGFAEHRAEIDRLGLCICGASEAGFVSVTTPLDHRSCESAA